MKVRIRSKHPSHRALRRVIDLPFRAVVNFGRTSMSFLPRGRYVLLNTPDAVMNAADKRLTKALLVEKQVATAEYWPAFNPPEDKFPVVVKHRFGSRGTGVYLMLTHNDLAAFFAQRGETVVKEMFIVERFRNYRFEYRLHATPNEVFLANRKGRKNGVPEGQRWKHTYENSVWYGEDNPEFRKPSTWEEIKAEACKAVAALGMDFGAVDVKVSSEGKFFIIEVNSAPSLGDHTREHYLHMIPARARQILTERGRHYQP